MEKESFRKHEGLRIPRVGLPFKCTEKLLINDEKSQRSLSIPGSAFRMGKKGVGA